jgi:hypothetical protein
MEFVEIPTPPPKQEFTLKPQKTEEWSVPSSPAPKPAPRPMEPTPSMDEIEASIPPVPKKSEPSDSGPIVFENPASSISNQQSDKLSAPPPLVFQPEESTQTKSPAFSPNQEKKGWTPSNAKPAPAPSIFPKAQPATTPSGFTSKPKANENLPFSKDTGLEQVSSTKAIDNLLGALHTKPHTTSSGAPLFGGSTSSFKKSSKPSIFIPEVKMEPKIIEPTPTAAPEPAKKKKKEKRQRGKKKEKSIIICSNCGAILSANYKFCNKCGSPVK